MPEPTLELTDEQVAQFHEQGFLVIEQYTTPDELAWMCDIYDRLFREQVGYEAGNWLDLAGTEEGDTPVMPQILGPSNYAPELRDTLCYANAQVVARRLFGPQAAAGGDHAILKPPRSMTATPWHQDEAYWNPAVRANAGSLWIPLQEATLDNGCMFFVPGSHKQDVQPHHVIDPKIHALEIDEPIEPSRYVPCPLPPGGATVHHARCYHYTSPNKTDGPRRAYIIGCGGPGEELDTPRDFYWQADWQTARKRRAEEYAAKQQSGA